MQSVLKEPTTDSSILYFWEPQLTCLTPSTMHCGVYRRLICACIVVHWWDDTDRGRRQCLEKNCHSPTLSTTNHTSIKPEPLQLAAGSHLHVYIWLLKLEEQGQEEESWVGQKGCWLFLQRAASYIFIVFFS